MGRTGGVMASACALGAAVALLAVGPSRAADEPPIAARWDMDEAAGASTMADSGPHGLDGTIGSLVEVGGGSYRWSPFDPVDPPLAPERLVVIEPDPALDPGLASFHVEMRYRSAGNYGNIVQKGQNAAVGGYWKFEHPWGLPSCAFRDEDGQLRAVLGRTSTHDGAWHVIRCELDRSWGDHGIIRVFVDGELDMVNALKEPLGRIANDQPVVIGGKLNCNQNTVACDYFWGEIDYVEVRKGGAGPPNPTTTTTVASSPPEPGGIGAATVGAVARRGTSSTID